MPISKFLISSIQAAKILIVCILLQFIPIILIVKDRFYV